MKIASPGEFGYTDPATSPNIKLAKISIFPDTKLMVMGSLGIFKKIINSSPLEKIDIPSIKLVRPKKNLIQTKADQYGLERVMKTCTESDNLITLSLGGGFMI